MTANPHLTEDQAQDLVDALVPRLELESLTAHAAGCARCQALVDSYQALSKALDALPLPELPADFTEGVLARVEVQERARARERRTVVAVVAAALGALVAVAVAAGTGIWVPAVGHLADELVAATRAFRLGADVLPPVVAALRLPIAAACAAAAVPVLYALSRLTHSPRAEIA